MKYLLSITVIKIAIIPGIVDKPCTEDTNYLVQETCAKFVFTKSDTLLLFILLDINSNSIELSQFFNSSGVICHPEGGGKISQ